MTSATRLGARWDGEAVTVSVFAPSVERVELCRLDADGTERRTDLARGDDGSTWGATRDDLRPGDRYGFRVHGESANPNRLLLDPAARAVAGEIDWADVDFADPSADTGPHVPWSVVVDERFDWGDDGRPATPMADTVIYEANVRSLTARHPAVPPEHRGTYLGLAHPAVLDHLVALGVTAVELLPIQHFVHGRAQWERGLRNLWGYDPVAWFAPHGAYATGDRGQQVAEAKAMVKALHAVGIEVILDVVFNHTGEYDAGGPTICHRGWDDARWYRHRPDGSYEDTTGCRNTVDLRPAPNQALVVDALRHWVEELHVDGFRFDLATTLLRGDDGVELAAPILRAIAAEPALADVKLIAEPWDAAADGYHLGGFPAPWCEWNDRYRGAVRDTWRGASPTRQELAARLAGSEDVFGPGRGPSASVNFVTAHDGFTLTDLVTYEHKHNDANGEGGRDGSDDNRSWNGGAEGPTDDPAIQAVRARQRRNLLATLLLSRGTPMVLAGDEIGHSQGGNNNAYCQDSEVSWLDWAHADAGLVAFARRALALRRARPELRGAEWLTDADVTWRAADGTVLDATSWGSADPVLVLAYPDLVLALNPSADDRELVLPDGRAWTVVLDTASPDGGPPALIASGATTSLPARTVMVLGSGSDELASSASASEGSS